jgi:hypothetical protein
MKISFLALSLLLISVPAFAQHHGQSHGGGQHQNHTNVTHESNRGRSNPSHENTSHENNADHNSGYNRENFGRDHAARFGRGDGRFYNGRREYSFGGMWFFSATYPDWFYTCNDYFDLGADGNYYAYCSSDPSLSFQVNVE